MAALGYDKNVTTTSGTTPAAVGNRIASNVLAYFLTDGSNEALSVSPPNDARNVYPDSGYIAPNPNHTLANGAPPTGTNPNLWQPLALSTNISQNGIIEPSNVQTYLGSQWLNVRPFALTRSLAGRPWLDPGAPSATRIASGQPLGTTNAFKSQMLEVIRLSSYLDASDGVLMDISPGATGNNALGTNAGTGHAVNPATGSAYATNIVKRGDFGRVLAEYWADGPASETPPGHWNVIFHSVRNHPAYVKPLGPNGLPMDDLEHDVKLYFALNAAMHDAACCAWSVKRFYHGTRPITGIRWMGNRGQQTNTSAANFDVAGLPLEAGVVEEITASSSAAGQRHAHLAAFVGKIAVKSWPGEPNFPALETQGAQWILASNWVPYQRKTFVSPAFPGYISGHSTFSRAAAEVLKSFTGSAFFPGGLASHTVPANTGLTFEKGPSQPITLQWATYYDAADQAGQSRLWGGIHISEDDLKGRHLGSQVGNLAYALAQKYWDGSIAAAAPTLVLTTDIAAQRPKLTWKSQRGLYYKVEYTHDLGFWLEIQGSTQARDSSMDFIDPFPYGFDDRPAKFYRVTQSLVP
jgi:hypothetical protein